MKQVMNWFWIIAGSVLSALAVVCFIVPNGLFTGGTAGVALLLHHVTSLTIGAWMVIINLPLILLGIRYFGNRYAVRSVITIALISILIDFFKEYLALQAVTNEIFLGAIFGGILLGLGLGLILKGGSSAGGSSIVATIIASKTKYKASDVLLFLDVVVVLFSLLVFDEVDKSLWSILSIYVTARMINLVLSGQPSKKIVHLVTENVELVASEIRSKLGKEGTILRGNNLFDKEEKTMILIVVEVSKIPKLKEISSENDPNSFLIISEASELLGRGNG